MHAWLWQYVCIHKAVADKVEFKSAHSAVADIPTKTWFKSEKLRFLRLINIHRIYYKAYLHWKSPDCPANVCASLYLRCVFVFCRSQKRSDWLRNCQILSSTARVFISVVLNIQKKTRRFMKWPLLRRAKLWIWQRTRVIPLVIYFFFFLAQTSSMTVYDYLIHGAWYHIANILKPQHIFITTWINWVESTQPAPEQILPTTIQCHCGTPDAK